MVWVSMIGADGYMAYVLSKLIAGHPATQISYYFDSIQCSSCTNEKYNESSMFDAIEKSDVVFNALPKKHSLNLYKEAVKQGKKVIDISMDTNINESSPDSLDAALKPVYGIPELNKEKIMDAFIVSNPSCYCTGAMLGLAPLVYGKLIDGKSVIIDSKSGVTSLSKTDKLVDSFVENNENVKTYKLGSNVHSIEIEQQLLKFFGEKVNIMYTPYIVPMSKGVLTTIYCTPLEPADTKSIIEVYKEFYKGNPFIRIYEEGKMPETKWVNYTNYCDIGIYSDKAANKIVVVTAIDNLIKGAAGQVIQNMNLMYGMDEKTGLTYGGIGL
ncbi:MAG: N-acetyl-gamma-glutamyl-phosphate reductase [Caulobacteraceae bacterium]